MYVGKPWPIAIPLRCLAVFGIATLVLKRFLHLPRWTLLTPQLRKADRHWTDEMARTFVKSFGNRLPVDQPCCLRAPERLEPRAEVAPEYRLTQSDLTDVYGRGFLSPFQAIDPDRANALRDLVLKRRTEPSEAYGFVTDRDRHLDTPELMEIVTSRAISERVAQLLGPDLVCWRSQVFAKPAGGGPIQWHQASTYMMEDNFLEPVLIPKCRDDLFQLTVWIALGNVTRKHGCLRFLTGSHNQMHNIRLGGGGGKGFYSAKYGFECEIDPDRVVEVEMTPGQALIFCERTVHGSGANETAEPRVGFNFRVVSSDVQVYPGGKRFHTAVHMNERYDLRRWKPVTLRTAGA